MSTARTFHSHENGKRVRVATSCLWRGDGMSVRWWRASSLSMSTPPPSPTKRRYVDVNCELCCEYKCLSTKWKRFSWIVLCHDMLRMRPTTITRAHTQWIASYTNHKSNVYIQLPLPFLLAGRLFRHNSCPAHPMTTHCLIKSITRRPVHLSFRFRFLSKYFRSTNEANCLSCRRKALTLLFGHW